MAKGLNRVPVREQEPKVRATNFDEVCLGYNKDEAVEEAQRCLAVKMQNVSQDARLISTFRHSLHR